MSTHNPYSPPEAVHAEEAQLVLPLDKALCRRYYRLLSVMLGCLVLGPVVAGILGAILPVGSSIATIGFDLLFLAWLACFPVCLVFIGKLASANRLSTVFWVALAFATPIGLILAWSRLRHLGRKNGWR